MTRAQLRHQEYADARRSPAPAFRVGDKVWFNAKNVITRRPKRKLDYRRLEPFTITKVVSPWAYELELPSRMRIHPVQHVSLLNPAYEDPLPGQVISLLLLINIDNEPEYYIKEILDSHTQYN